MYGSSIIEIGKPLNELHMQDAELIFRRSNQQDWAAWDRLEADSNQCKWKVTTEYSMSVVEQ